jgi:hypothetical protein
MTECLSDPTELALMNIDTPSPWRYFFYTTVAHLAIVNARAIAGCFRRGWEAHWVFRVWILFPRLKAMALSGGRAPSHIFFELSRPPIQGIMIKIRITTTVLLEGSVHS